MSHLEELVEVQALVIKLREQLDEERRQVTQLKQALESARRIGAAIGIVMAAARIPEEAAFVMLTTASQNSNRKLREVADDVVTTGEVPAGRSGADVGRPHPAPG